MTNTVKRPERPYLAQQELEDLARMNTELMAELWILRDRVTVLEHMLEEAAVISRAKLHEFVPTGELAAELERERDALVRRVAGAPHEDSFDLDSLKRQADIG